MYKCKYFTWHASNWLFIDDIFSFVILYQDWWYKCQYQSKNLTAVSTQKFEGIDGGFKININKKILKKKNNLTKENFNEQYNRN